MAKKETGTSAAVRMFSVALTPDELEVLHREAARRRVSMGVIVRELLADNLDDFREVTRDRRTGGSRYAASG